MQSYLSPEAAILTTQAGFIKVLPATKLRLSPQAALPPDLYNFSIAH
jgi:hypothetical protein